jgi:hypothetical protein
MMRHWAKKAWHWAQPRIPAARRQRWLARSIVTLIGGACIVAAAYGLWRFLSSQLQPAATGPDAFSQRKEFLQLYSFIIGGLIAAGGVWFTWRRVAAAEKTVSVAQEAQITERFTRAVDQLGSDKLELRLGGIYALERIARDSQPDHWPIMEILTAYVRERAPGRRARQPTTSTSLRPTSRPFSPSSAAAQRSAGKRSQTS